MLAGAAAAGKSTWAAERFRRAEIVSSDQLRDVVGSGPADLEASADAFALLDQIVTARTRRGLTTVVDTLGLDPARRREYLAAARRAGMPAVLVVLSTPPEVCRLRNRARDRPVPAPVITEQLRRVRTLLTQAPDEGWDAVEIVAESVVDSGPTPPAPAPGPVPADRAGLSVMLQVSRFPWGAEPTTWLTDLARAADDLGFAGLALMDHLIQIPQVDRAWEPIPEPWVTLGLVAGLDTALQLGTLVSPVTFRYPGIIAKAAATLDALSNGRAFCGLGAGWWLREHQAYGLDFPGDRDRLDRLQVCIETLRALWAPGTKAYAGRYVHLPETTCYPRPVGRLPIIVGGSGEQRTLKIVAEQADAANLPADDQLGRRIGVLHEHCASVGRDPAEVEVTVLDVPIVGIDRDDVARRVERLRGRQSATVFGARHHAGTAADQAERYRGLSAQGVGTVFLALPDLADADDLRRCAPLLSALG